MNHITLQLIWAAHMDFMALGGVLADNNPPISHSIDLLQSRIQLPYLLDALSSSFAIPRARGLYHPSIRCLVPPSLSS